MKYSIALTSDTDAILRAHLLRLDGQEDLCYALWYPSQGADRMTALVGEPILPLKDERRVHGNASTTGNYLGRVIDLAEQRRAGIAFLHSHPYPGWQGMSQDDLNTERRQAPAVKSTTQLPLLGMTVGTDGTWSGRFWVKTAPKTYERAWCSAVRVVGAKGLEVSFNNALLPPPGFREELKRTVSAWGEESQQKLARLRFGVVGVGSVGSIVAETLARMGIQHITLIDYDHVERHNLDRLLNATLNDAMHHRRKVDVIGEAIAKHATAESPSIDKLPFTVVEENGFKAALDCDILFSCVDRPWARHVLNYLAYAYLIPVIDGGILIRRTPSDRLRQASWRSHAVLPGRRCLQCIGQYDPDHVNVERRGDLDDPSYIAGLPVDHALRRNENVFPFSAHLASSLVLHALSLTMAPLGIPDVGEQIYHFVGGTLDSTYGESCYPGCYFSGIIGKGDAENLSITGVDPGATRARLSEQLFAEHHQQVTAITLFGRLVIRLRRRLRI